MGIMSKIKSFRGKSENIEKENIDVKELSSEERVAMIKESMRRCDEYINSQRENAAKKYRDMMRCDASIVASINNMQGAPGERRMNRMAQETLKELTNNNQKGPMTDSEHLKSLLTDFLKDNGLEFSNGKIQKQNSDDDGR